METRADIIAVIRNLPAQLREKVSGLTVEQLTTPYNAGEWTVAQNIHHLADTHMVCIRRFKLILTSPEFHFTSYDVNAIAEYPDAKDADIEYSLKILDGLQARWAILLENLNDDEWAKIGFSQSGDLSIEEIARIYAQARAQPFATDSGRGRLHARKTATAFIVKAAPQFDFRQTVFSHGWYMLAPFSWDEERAVLATIYKTTAGSVLCLELSAAESGVRVAVSESDTPVADLRDEIETLVRRNLSLDQDLRPFYAAMRGFDGYGWLEAQRRGRILVGASLWEDLAKVLLTTNTSWAQTVQMCARLCQLGTPHPLHSRSSCLPQRRADHSAGF